MSYDVPKTFEAAQIEMAYNAPRPVFENNESLSNENLFAKYLEESKVSKGYKFKLDKCPPKYHFDFALTNLSTGKIEMLIEYKHRKCSWESQKGWGGYRIGLDKWSALCDWQEKLNIKCVFYAHFSDSPPNGFHRYRIFKEELKELELVFWGNHTRHKDDNEPAVILPCEKFTYIQL
jgi:hypothetical protein